MAKMLTKEAMKKVNVMVMKKATKKALQKNSNTYLHLYK